MITFREKGRDFPLLSCKCYAVARVARSFFGQIAQHLGPKRVASG